MTHSSKVTFEMFRPKLESTLTDHRRGKWQLLLAAVIVGGAIASPEAPSLAQSKVIPDGTLGAESSVVVPFQSQPVEVIRGGAIRGGNLFHSFLDFNVSTGRAVYLTNPTGVQNILSRVTGTDPSNIVGTLGVLGNANLFLLNPNGIVFGPNASLDVRGSFLASTASSFKFSDGTFSAVNPASSVLTINVPLASTIA